jgi:O-antigen ligase
MKDQPAVSVKWEFYSLCLLAASLPIVEVTKNLAWFMLVIFFAIRNIKTKQDLLADFLGNMFLGFMLLSAVAAVGASFNGYDSGKISDIIRYGLVGWMLMYIPLSKQQIYTILALLFVATSIGVIVAYLETAYWQGGAFELRSVGHINHTAIFIALTLGAVVPLLLSRTSSFQARLVLMPMAIILTAGLFFADSRAGIVALAIIVAIALLHSLMFHLKTGVAVLLLAIAAGGYMVSAPPKVVEELVDRPMLYMGNTPAPREKLWNSAVYGLKKEPVFGIGFGNYSIIDPEQLSLWFPDEDFTDNEQFYYSSHAHNRFLNSAVEGGIFGFAGLMLLLVGPAICLWRNRKFMLHKSTSAAFWVIPATSMAIVTVIGLVNTTIHHEHGLLTMMLFGLSFNFLNRLQSSQAPAKTVA